MKIFRQTFTNHSDEALMREITRRNEAAFEVLYDRYAARMYRFFYRMLGRDAARAEDFTQELFLKIIEKPHLFDPERIFRSWLYTLATNLCKNEYRRAALPEASWEKAEPWENPLPEQLDRQLFEHQLRLSIESLSETQRQCFVLRYQEAMSIAEIAVIAGCPEGTVKSRLHHAIRQVAGQMEDWKAERY